MPPTPRGNADVGAPARADGLPRATGWREPDDGIWEVRGPRRHFTHSKVMAWVAIDRAIKTAEEYGLEGPVDRWKEVRKEIHDQVCDQGFNADKGSFTQYYGSDQLDASLLMIPLVGFLPAHDPRVRGTIEAIERELVEGGFVLRYRTADTGDVDGLTGREGAFLACSFWLADCLSLLGRDHDARQLLDRLLGLRNDLGLLSEEYDPVAGRLVGNFPQAFSHVSLVNSASKIGGEEKPIVGPCRRRPRPPVAAQGKSRTATRHMGVFSARTCCRGWSTVGAPISPVVPPTWCRRPSDHRRGRPRRVGRSVDGEGPVGQRSTRRRPNPKKAGHQQGSAGDGTTAVKKAAARKAPAEKATAATTATQEGGDEEGATAKKRRPQQGGDRREGDRPGNPDAGPPPGRRPRAGQGSARRS